MNRRIFLARIVQLFSAAISVLLGLPVIRFVMGSAATEETSSWYEIGKTESLSEEINQVSFVRILRDGWQTRYSEEYVWVRKKHDGKFTVFEPHCTHLGCGYGWNQNAREFQCPCHGGKFDMDGNRIAGPPKRPLDRYEVKVEADRLLIGKLVKV